MKLNYKKKRHKVKSFCKYFQIIFNALKISGSQLRIALKAADMSQQEAADLIGVSRQTINVWCKMGVLDDAIVQTVKTKAGIDLGVLGAVYKIDQQQTFVEESRNNYRDHGTPIYDINATAGGVQVYSDMNSSDPVGFARIPGFEDCDFAIPVWGDSMYPQFKSGSYVLGKWIKDPALIAWGECYYIEYGDYRMVKLLVRGKTEEDVLLCSINDSEVSKGRMKYAPIPIKKSEIRKLALIKGSFSKNNH